MPEIKNLTDKNGNTIYPVTESSAIKISNFSNKTLDTVIRDNLTKIDSMVINVIDHGISNNGDIIGTELNDLIISNYGRTLYFPDGIYNLSEPIETPWTATNNVHLYFSPNAIIKSDLELDALLKIGFTNIDHNFDRSQNLPNYIYGGQFNCTNVNCGIKVNGTKQLVELGDIVLYKGKKTHIMVTCSSDYTGTGSADVLMQNINIKGLSSNEDGSYGIYIDSDCSDCRFNDILIYGCKEFIYTKSTGHYMNNIHILSQVTTGGSNLYENNFIGTIGLHIACGGQFFINNFYFDTVDTCIYIERYNPYLTMNGCYFFSYLNNFGSSFIKRDSSVSNTLDLILKNSAIDIKKDNYKILDCNMTSFAFDPYNRTQITDLVLNNREKLYKYDAYLSQKIRNVYNDFLIQTNNKTFDENWVVLGLIPWSEGEIHLNISFSPGRSIDLYYRTTLDSISYNIRDTNNDFYFSLGKATVNNDIDIDFRALLFKLNSNTQNKSGFPIITTISGSNCFIRTPSDSKKYSLTDYNINESSIEIIIDKNN